MSQIKIAKTDQEISDSYPVMSKLRPDYTPGDYIAQVKKQISGYHFKLATLSDKGRVYCAAGFRITESLAWKKSLYIDDLVTDDNSRSKGYGKQMLDWLVQYAKDNDCIELHLDSGVQRHDAHRFYLRERMDIVFYHFKRVL